MAEIAPCRILIVRFGSTPVTFLNRLISGLAVEGVHVSIAGDKKDYYEVMALGNVDLLWAPSWKGNFVSKASRLVKLMLTCFSPKRLSWLRTQIQSSPSLRRSFFRLYQYLPFMKGNWDVIYFPWNSTAIEYRGLYDLEIPVIVSCRGSQVNVRPHLPGQEAYVRALRDSLHDAAAVHCVSAHIQESVTALGVNENQCSIIRPAVDPDFFTPPSKKNQNPRFTIVSTGSLIWRKSYETMLVALKLLVDAKIDAQLHIIGEGPDYQHILFMIHDLSLQDRVILHGRLAPPAVRDLLQQADIFVLSSLSEGIANAALEAMSCGLPVVTTDCGGMNEAVTDGVTGYVVPLRDPHAMASALDKLARDPASLSRMGGAARTRILQDFSLDDHIAQFIDLIQKTTIIKN